MKMNEKQVFDQATQEAPLAEVVYLPFKSDADIHAAHQRFEKKHERRLKTSHKLLGGAAAAAVMIGGLIGINKINDYTYKPNESPQELSITKAYEAHQKASFDVMEGSVQIKAGAIIRENPYIIEDEAIGSENKVDANRIIDGYNDNQEISITNPILVPDTLNPANGMWYGFMVKEGDKLSTYWTNGQNIIDRSKDAQIRPYDGSEQVGVVSQ